MATVVERIASLKPNERFFSLEFFPPKTDMGSRNLLARLHRMLALKPLFLTVTWGAGGLTSEKSLDLAATCQSALEIPTVLHLTCTNTNKEIIDNALKTAKNAGIRNILALRGDPPRTEEYWTPDCNFSNAVDLVRYIKQQYGDYFCIGVAGYPEGHVDGADTTHQNVQKDLSYLVEKVKAGAEFVVTQLFFDVDKFAAYEELFHSTPELKNVALIPGLMPVTTYKVFKRATKLSNALVPTAIAEKIEQHLLNDDQVKSIGIDVLCEIIEKIDTLCQGRVKGFHFYTLNLEKAVASIVERIPRLSNTAFELADHDDVFDSDSETEAMVIPNKPRRRLSVNDNSVALAGDGSRAIVSRAIFHDQRTLLEISKGKGALGKDATWDEFPNGRFGDSNSPAYGEIDGYGPSLKLQSVKKIVDTWGSPATISDISKVFLRYLSNRITVLPWVDSELSSETALIQEELIELNSKGWFTLASQPAVNACPSTDKILGWGPPYGRLFQKSFVEMFIPKDDWDQKLKPQLQDDIDSMTITYYCGDSKGNILSNFPIRKGHNSKTAITWGVFSSKEVLQPTVIDYESFKAWNEESFLLWVEWARSYPKDLASYKLLNGIPDKYYLVSLVHHDYVHENALWLRLLN